MSGFKVCFLVLIICCLLPINQCRRGGGGHRTGGGSRPSPSYGWKPSHSPSYSPSYSPSHSPSYNPSYSPSHSPSYSPSYRPSARPNRPSTARPPPSRPPSYPSTARPSWDRPTSRRPGSTSRPSGPTPPPHQRPGTTRRPPISTPRHHVSSTRSPTFGALPPRPGSKDYKPQGPPVNSGSHQTVYNIKNKYYSYPGQYSVPVPSPHYGYYYTPSYHYSSFDTGSTALGFYLGYTLGHLSTPTYSHYSFYDGYRPRYDHYTVHHYYHNKESVPPQQEIRSNNIVGCIEDSAKICPANTTSLCTSTGTLMCVVTAASTVPCAGNSQVNCVKSTISCRNNTAQECKNAKTENISIDIPCVSTAQVHGNITYQNNTIKSMDNNITVSSNGTNSTVSTNGTMTEPPKSTTSIPESNQTLTNTTSSRKKREAPQNFCVTILAVPAEKPPTEGEKAFDNAKEIFSTFWENAWGV